MRGYTLVMASQKSIFKSKVEDGNFSQTQENLTETPRQHAWRLGGTGWGGWVGRGPGVEAAVSLLSSRDMDGLAGCPHMKRGWEKLHSPQEKPLVI